MQSLIYTYKYKDVITININLKKVARVIGISSCVLAIGVVLASGLYQTGVKHGKAEAKLALDK